MVFFYFQVKFRIFLLKVLPRQSCGLYTTTRNYTNYPNGSHHLEEYLMGGRLFRTILTNPVINIYLLFDKFFSVDFCIYVA
jgi:hypothetical protein